MAQPSHSIVLAVVVVLLLAILPSAQAQCYGYPLHPKHDSSDCWLTFGQSVSWVGMLFAVDSVPSRLMYWSCPPGCLELSQSAPQARVYGSYPYHGNSSLCLAAIHSGLVNATAGGMVVSSVYFPQDFSNSSTQTIFPFGSSQGTLSNGVQSETVPSSWYSVPSDHRSFSFIPRGRGQLVTQRQQAPFPARAGHLHAHWAALYDPYFSNKIDLILGGYNATHYLVAASLSCSSACCPQQRGR